MPSWKKVVTSGSNAVLNDITLSGNISGVSASFSYVTASRVEIDASTLTIGGTEIGKTQADNLRNTTGTNTGDVTLSGTPDYITISNQVITRNQVDLANDVTGTLPVGNGGTGATTLTSNRVLTGNGTSAIQAEGNLSFSGTELGVTGGVDITGTYQTNNVVAINSDGNFEVHDNRATSGSTDLGVKGVRFDFKSNSADGLSDGGTYHGLMTIQQWNDTSGGHTHNLGFTDNGYIYHRNASIAGSWGNWKKLIQEDESGNVAIENGDLNASADISGSTIRASGDVIAFNSSDERFKDNIQSISEPLWKLNQIGGYEFDWNDKQDVYEGHDVGVIAQEVHKVLPEVVGEKSDGYLGVKYEKIVPLLIESVKELTKKTKKLERELKKLKRK